LGLLAAFLVFSQRVLCNTKRPTKRAPDAGDSGAIPSIFLRHIIFPVGRRPAARPSAGNANRWALHVFQIALKEGRTYE